MPLQDHFHPPLRGPRQWHAFHNSWATFIASELNQQLPQGYYAEPNVMFGIEIDVAALEEGGRSGPVESPAGWAPAAPTLTIPLTITTDMVEVSVFSNMGGLALVGAIELISPSNKHGPSEREALVSKCAAYLHQGAGLVMVDIVTERGGNLHDDLLASLHDQAIPLQSDLYATAYRPVQRGEQAALDIWQQALALGAVLPKMPLWLQRGICMPIDLEATYNRTCRELRITTNGI